MRVVARHPGCALTVHPAIDLRCCDAGEMLASLPDGCAHLVVSDAPWWYSQRIGATQADTHYACLRTPEIRQHINDAARVGRRMAFWVTCPLLGEWMAADTAWGPPKTAGSWVKSGRGVALEKAETAQDVGAYGSGWHWAGCAELVLVYTRPGSYTNRAAKLRNAWIEPPDRLHSRKPVQWQVQWVQRWVPPGGLVVDLYAGTGSVAEAVLLAGEGRRYCGAEIDPTRYAASLASLARVPA